MAERHTDASIPEQGNSRAGLKRRGILAAAGAALVAVAARQAQPVSATNSSLLYPSAGTTAATNTATARTILTGAFDNTLLEVTNTATTGGAFGIQAGTSGGSAIIGTNNATGNLALGIHGTIAGGSGVQTIAISGQNLSTGTDGIGVFGQCDIATANTAIGVKGTTLTGTGVLGTIPGSSAADTIGVKGSNLSNGASPIGVFGQTTGFNGIGVLGQSDVATGAGVKGSSTAGIGIFGTIPSGSTVGTIAAKGINLSTGTGGIGVLGQSDTAGAGTGIGVKGSSTTGVGVFGTIPSGSAVATIGVLGRNDSSGVAGIGVSGLIGGGSGNVTIGVLGSNTSTGTGGIGVFGQCNVATGFGVKGLSTNGVGVSGIAGSGGAGSAVYGVSGITHGGGVSAGLFGSSDTAYGIVGSTTAAGYSGLTAITGTAGVAALAATATVNTAYAAYFQGTTVVQGDFAVVGGAKSAAVKDAAGQHRLVYCVESPEAWFEDFGEGALATGKASVALDKTFAEIVHTDQYHVYLTPHDAGNKGLAATLRTASGFVVQELHGGTSGGTFSWRVAARRKDIAGTRLAKFDLPKINHPDPAKLPILPSGHP